MWLSLVNLRKPGLSRIPVQHQIIKMLKRPISNGRLVMGEQLSFDYVEVWPVRS